MVVVGATGTSGVAAVLGVAAVVCVSSAVAGEMLQDLKVGHILGGTPWKMQVGNIIGILLASLVLYFPLMLLHGAFTFGSKELPAPQAGLMAALSKGIVGGEMAWPLVIVGMLMGFAFILVQVKSPMLVAVGMYLPLETTFAIFVGGMIKGVVDKIIGQEEIQRRPEGPGEQRRHPAGRRPDRRRGIDRPAEARSGNSSSSRTSSVAISRRSSSGNTSRGRPLHRRPGRARPHWPSI